MRGFAIYQLILIPFLIACNFFFVAAEMALTRLRRTRIEQLVEEGDRTAMRIMKHLNDPDRFISACQLGITIATLCLGGVGEAAFAEDMAASIVRLGEYTGWSLPAIAAAKAICYIAAFVITAFLQTVFGELLPKTYTFNRAEQVMRFTVLLMDFWLWLTGPFIRVLNGTNSFLLKLFNLNEPPRKHMVHSEEELKMLVSASHEEGVLEPEEEEMLHSVFDFSDTVTGEIMTPRTDMIGIPETATVREFVDLALKHGFSRLPVFDGNLDNIFGLVHIRDCLKALVEHKENTQVKEFTRKVLVVPENKNLGDLLPEFQKSKTHMAIVVDEYGATRGIVTLEDLLEELVGDIADEYDIVQEYIQVQPDGSLIVDGKLDLEEANEKLGLEIEDEEFNTLGGHVFGRLGREPEPGDEVTADGYTLRIEESDRHRIIKLRLIRHDRTERQSDTNGTMTHATGRDREGKKENGTPGSKAQTKSVEASN